MNIIRKISLALIIIGALNWGLVSLFKFDLVAALLAGGGNFGNISTLSRIVYGLVGLSALYVGTEFILNLF